MMITTSSDLVDFVARARTTDAVALDTEFVWERTYYPQLGLIQVALSDQDCFLIDPIAIEDLSPLGELLTDRGVVKILHDAPQDLAILHMATGAATQNVFDTRLAAGFASFPATLSLCKLIKELLDIELPKTETRTNWLKRPLDEKQVQYALDDVRYLRAVRVLLLSRIIGPKIKSWLQDELNLLNNPLTYLDTTNGQRFRRIRGAGTLSRQSLAILKELTEWREKEAIKQDKPRGHIVKDTTLIALAKKKTVSLDECTFQGCLSTKAQKRYGNKIVEIIQSVLKADEKSYPELQRSTRLSNKDKETLDRMHNLIDLKCNLLGIDPILVGNNTELKALTRLVNKTRVDNPAQLRQTEGWRKNLLEDFFRYNR